MNRPQELWLTRSLVVMLVATAVVGILATMGGVRWAKRQTRGAQFVASGMMLVLGMVRPMVVKPPEQGVVEANEDKGKKGSESGDPPAG